MTDHPGSDEHPDGRPTGDFGDDSPDHRPHAGSVDDVGADAEHLDHDAGGTHDGDIDDIDDLDDLGDIDTDDVDHDVLLAGDGGDDAATGLQLDDDSIDDRIDDGDTDGDTDGDIRLDLPAGSDIDAEIGVEIVELLAMHDIEADDFARTLHRLDLDVEPDARAFAVALEQHDVVATVEHTDFDRVAHLLDAGAEIRLGNGERLIGLDDVTDEAIVRSDGVDRRLPLAELDDRWADSTYELLVSSHQDRVIAVMSADTAALDDGGIFG